jgi:hypothetical protein
VQISLALLEVTGLARPIQRLRSHPNTAIRECAVDLCGHWWSLSTSAAILAKEALQALPVQAAVEAWE